MLWNSILTRWPVEGLKEGGEGSGILSCFSDADFKFPPGNSLGERIKIQVKTETQRELTAFSKGITKKKPPIS